MSFTSIRKRTHEAAQPIDAGPQMCEASNCPCIASVKVEGGRWCCTTHAFAASEKWPRITEGLRDHDWLIGFTADMQRMDRRADDWRAFAHQFWHGQDDYCKPHAEERAIPYFNRMKGELEYRLGLCQRPAPRIPSELGKTFADMATPAWKKALMARAAA